ncbi:MAG TPA: cupin domain-containing protein [Bacteroidia bacterium]|nr:cupin domain-containing protein [Bacteroidia bacterium]
MNFINAGSLIKSLKLQVHPEGGYYRETYRSDEVMHEGDLPERFTSSRCFSTAIYFLLENRDFSAFHRIRSDETWHFYAGSALELYEITVSGKLKRTLIGSDLESGEQFQYTVPFGSWFASRVKDGNGFALLGCTVAPGFDFRDFELGDRHALVNEFPEYSDLIRSLTR